MMVVVVVVVRSQLEKKYSLRLPLPMPVTCHVALHVCAHQTIASLATTEPTYYLQYVQVHIDKGPGHCKFS